MILRFNENFEAFIDAEYPNDISKSLNIKASDLMNIYTLHRMKEEQPNFFQMEIKDFSVASFFTGFSFKKYVGYPNYAISVILSDDDLINEELAKDFEGMVRKVAFDLLNKKNEPDFIKMVKEYYIMLGNADLEPYWGESNEEEVVIIPNESKKEGYKRIEFSQKMTSEDIKPVLQTKPGPPVMTNQAELDLEKRFDKLEKEVLEQEIKDLKMLLKEKSVKIKEITQQLTDQKSEISKIEEWKQASEKFKKENEILTTNANNLTELSNQQKEKIDSQTEKLDQIMEELNDKNIQIVNFKNELEKSKDQIDESKKFKKETEDLKKQLNIIKNENENLKKEVEKMVKDNGLHIDNITDLKLKVKEFKNKLTSEVNIQDNLAEAIIDLKKEVKVLRRERDHYRDIIKKNNLL
jgi:myosin heavy subunit